MSKEEIVLIVEGRKYTGWQDISVNKSLNSIAGSFSFKMIDKLKEANNTDRYLLKVRMGDKCTVKIIDKLGNSHIVLTGYIEEMNPSYDSTSHSITVSGRDNTGDLVDCSYYGEGEFGKPNEWKNQTVFQIIRNLCRPFGIAVKVFQSSMGRTETLNTKLQRFTANPGDTVFDLINRLCKIKGLLPISRGDGFLWLVRSGGESSFDSIELGKNIVSGALTQSNKERYSQYVTKGRGVDIVGMTLDGFEPIPGINDTEIQAMMARIIQPSNEQVNDVVYDPVIRRNRPLVILADDGITPVDAKNSSQWEADKRAGKSRNVTYVVPGWTQTNNAIWEINKLTSIRDNLLGINEEWLIHTINYSFNESNGSLSTIQLSTADAYKLIPKAISTKTMDDLTNKTWEPLF